MRWLRRRAGPPNPIRIPDSQSSTYAVILSDRKKKLEPLLSVAHKSSHLLDSLNAKLNPKVLRWDVTKGYHVTDGQDRSRELSSLSSGEQHPLVLLHELLFEVAPGTLILMDEPELSLHVDWLRQVIEELEEIAQLSGVDFLLATHSPYIVDKGNPKLVRIGPST
jgi:ABC-type lipoprotein export system ATPase subunit